jgi:hypothetical protein
MFFFIYSLFYIFFYLWQQVCILSVSHLLFNLPINSLFKFYYYKPYMFPIRPIWNYFPYRTHWTHFKLSSDHRTGASQHWHYRPPLKHTKSSFLRFRYCQLNLSCTIFWNFLTHSYHKIYHWLTSLKINK